MEASTFALIEPILVFGGILAFVVWQLRELRKLREEREAKERADREKAGDEPRS
jgi:hypothetical protein